MTITTKITPHTPSTGYETLIHDCMIGDNICSSAPTASRARGARYSRFLELDSRRRRGLTFYAPAATARRDRALLARTPRLRTL